MQNPYKPPRVLPGEDQPEASKSQRIREFLHDPDNQVIVGWLAIAAIPAIATVWIVCQRWLAR